MGLGPNREVTLEIVGVAKDAQVSQVAATDSSYLYLPATPSAQRGLASARAQPGGFRGARGEHPRDDAGARCRPRGAREPARRESGILADGFACDRGLVRIARACWRCVLASVGVYGVVSYVVSRRRREVGIRMTLGATARDVQRLFLRQTLRPVVIGCCHRHRGGRRRLTDSGKRAVRDQPLRSDRVHRRAAVSPRRRGRRKPSAHARGAQDRPDGRSGYE